MTGERAVELVGHLAQPHRVVTDVREDLTDRRSLSRHRRFRPGEGRRSPVGGDPADRVVGRGRRTRGRSQDDVVRRATGSDEGVVEPARVVAVEALHRPKVALLLAELRRCIHLVQPLVEAAQGEARIVAYAASL